MVKGTPSRGAVERRSHARFAKTFELEGTSFSGGVAARMLASDLSLGGLYCSSATDFPEMTRLAVRLLLPEHVVDSGAQPLDVEAVVVRRKRLNSSSGSPRFELGLFFVSMSDVQRSRLARFLARG